MPGAGGTQRLPRIISPALAKELIFTARVFSGEEANKMGIVNYSVAQNEENDAAFQKALKLAEEILPNGPVGVRMAKRAINKGTFFKIVRFICSYIEKTFHQDRKLTWELPTA